MAFSLDQLAARIAERAKASPDESYTAKLLADGIDRCARKFGEEAVETIIAAASRDRAGLTGEAADVLYHLLVLLEASKLPLGEVMAEMARGNPALPTFDRRLKGDRLGPSGEAAVARAPAHGWPSFGMRRSVVSEKVCPLPLSPQRTVAVICAAAEGQACTSLSSP